MPPRCGIRRRTAFLTDVEGDLSYFIRYTELSKVVAWSNGALAFRDNTSHFVYGGDVFDRGNDLRFSRALLSFYDTYPTRVHLILGNRDINKMVFGLTMKQVLGEAQLPPEVAQRLLFPIPLTHHSGLCKKYLSYAEYLKEKGLPLKMTRTTFVQWALSYKMGAASTFEYRLRELREERGDSVTEEDVAQSFLDAASPGGVYYEYLKRGKIADIVDGALFVHGTVANLNVGFVPSKQFSAENGPVQGCNFMTNHGSAEEWVKALNDFKEEGFREWKSGGSGIFLRQYAYPVSVAPHSVVVQSLVGINGPRYLELDAVEFLNRSGVTTVCGGHQPSGDSPSIVQQPGLVSIAADNSYCAGDGTRGASCVEVLLEEDGVVRVHGLRTDGVPYNFEATGRLLGRHLGGGWWVKLKLSENLYEIQRTHDGYRSKEVQLLTTDEVEKRLREWNQPPIGGEAPERWNKRDLAPSPGVLKTKRSPPPQDG
ncbi:Calcineurin-like phosphoesterase domain [Trypanosoma melophagium]|uniref:Calcineurin-like phosphoesterase domain n=1 Tax=Trypanosoma melophagium TaxID=715481 RepID=UPI00351AAD50|nr:Calcineurin-like phosphoesterase domain [Trypanosoma melophagium]